MANNQRVLKSRSSVPRQVIFVKNEHRWCFNWIPGQEAAIIKSIQVFAGDPEADFDWFDTSMVCQEISRLSFIGDVL